MGYTCRSCGELHDDLPFAFHAPAPDEWSHDGDPDSELTTDLCIIGGEHYFIHGLVVLPVADADEDFAWGVWVQLSPEDFGRTVAQWDSEGRENDDPMPGRVCTGLPDYETSTLGLRCHVRTQPVGERPRIELDPTEHHPLAVEQRNGITLKRVEEIAAHFEHMV